jgi:outer membrane lipoprotein SlyB
MNIRSSFTVAVAAAMALSGCGTYETQQSTDTSSYPAYPAHRGSQQAYAYGVVDRIEVVNRGAPSNIAGTVIGGIVGGLIGHQFGSGRGNTAATIAGAAGGAIAGSEIERRSRGPNETFRVTVRMDNGDLRVVVQDDITDLRPGDRVRIEGNRIIRA